MPRRPRHPTRCCSRLPSAAWWSRSAGPSCSSACSGSRRRVPASGCGARRRTSAAASSAAADMGAGPELARTRLDHARMLLARGATGDLDRAATLLADAAGGFEALGMPAFVERTARVAEHMGIRLPAGSKCSGDPRHSPRRSWTYFAASPVVATFARSPTSWQSAGVRPASHPYGPSYKIGLHGDVPQPRSTGRQTAAATAPPSNPLAIMFTDIEGSTAVIDRFGDTTAREMLRVHDEIVRAPLLRTAARR